MEQLAASTTWPDAAQGAGAIVQAVAILAGGGWAYFKFVHGRTFAHRGELDIRSSFVVAAGEVGALHVCVTFRNTGLSQIPLSENAKQVYTYATSGDDPEMPFQANFDPEEEKRLERERERQEAEDRRSEEREPEPEPDQPEGEDE